MIGDTLQTRGKSPDKLRQKWHTLHISIWNGFIYKRLVFKNDIGNIL